jgi:hypothetical protein
MAHIIDSQGYVHKLVRNKYELVDIPRVITPHEIDAEFAVSRDGELVNVVTRATFDFGRDKTGVVKFVDVLRYGRYLLILDSRKRLWSYRINEEFYEAKHAMIGQKCRLLSKNVDYIGRSLTDEHCFIKEDSIFFVDKDENDSRKLAVYPIAPLPSPIVEVKNHIFVCRDGILAIPISNETRVLNQPDAELITCSMDRKSFEEDSNKILAFYDSNGEFIMRVSYQNEYGDEVDYYANNSIINEMHQMSPWVRSCEMEDNVVLTNADGMSVYIDHMGQIQPAKLPEDS